MSEPIRPVRLVALDLDGTLLNRRSQITPRTRSAVLTASQQGVVVVPATGRALATLPPEVAQLPGVRYVLTTNGAAVWDLGSEPMSSVYSRYADAQKRHITQPVCLLQRLFPPQKAREVFGLCQQYEGELTVFSDGRAIKDRESQDLAAARMARHCSTEADQPYDSRFTVVADLADWLSRGAHAIEKLWRSLHMGGTWAWRGWLWQTRWAPPAARPWRWATASTTAHCWKKPVSALPWPTLCRPSKHWQTTSARRIVMYDGRFTVVPDLAEWMSREAHAIEKFCLFFGSAEKAQAALPAFRQLKGVEVVQGSPDNVEVTAQGVDKGEALLALADQLGIPRSETMAVGDSENDRALLEKAGVSAAMANAMPSIQALADYVSQADCDADGVAELFEKLVLVR